MEESNEKLSGTAKFTKLSNDLFWDFTAVRSMFNLEGHFSGIEYFHAKWTGYNDANWWNNVAPNVEPLKCVGDKGTVAYLHIDFNSGRVEEVKGGAK